MTEVDWLLEQFALVLEERDAEIAALTARLHPGEARPTKDDGTATTDGTADDEPPAGDPASEDPASDDPASDDPASDDEEQSHA